MELLPITSLRVGYVIPGAMAVLSQRLLPIEGMNMPAGWERYGKEPPRPLLPKLWSCSKAPLPALEPDCKEKRRGLGVDIEPHDPRKNEHKLLGGHSKASQGLQYHLKPLNHTEDCRLVVTKKVTQIPAYIFQFKIPTTYTDSN